MSRELYDLQGELLFQAKEGNALAYEKLHEMYVPLIEKMVLRYQREGLFFGEEEDVRQEAEIAFFRAVVAYDLTENEVTFGLFAKICISNRLISYWRKQKAYRNAKHPLADEEWDRALPESVESVESPLDHLLKMESEEDVRVFLAKVLSEYERKIFYAYLDGNSTKQIAQEVQRTEKSVTNALYRIRVKLRRQWKSSV